MHFDKVSIRFENDFFGDRHDRWRSNAFELEVYGFIFGNYIYNNDPKGEGSKVDYEGTDRRGNLHPLRNHHNLDKRKGAWINGQTYYSPWYVGYRKGNQVLRLGYSHPSAQDLTQNNVHRLFPPGYQNYYNKYDNFIYSPHRYSGYYNPYSLW